MDTKTALTAFYFGRVYELTDNGEDDKAVDLCVKYAPETYDALVSEAENQGHDFDKYNIVEELDAIIEREEFMKKERLEPEEPEEPEEEEEEEEPN